MKKFPMRAVLAAAFMALTAAPGFSSNFGSFLCQPKDADIGFDLVKLVAALQEQLDTRPVSDPHYGLIQSNKAQAEVYLAKLRAGQTSQQFYAKFVCGVDISPS